MEDKKTAPSRQKEQPQRNVGSLLLSIVTVINTLQILVLTVNQRMIIRVIAEVIDAIDIAARTLASHGNLIELIIDVFEQFNRTFG